MTKPATITDVKREAKRLFGSSTVSVESPQDNHAVTWMVSVAPAGTGRALRGYVTLTFNDLTKRGAIQGAFDLLAKLEARR